MSDFKVGDIVARKSHGGDVYFKIADIINTSDGKKVYVLKGMMYRIEADALEEDLVKQNPDNVRSAMKIEIMNAKRNSYSRSNRSRRIMPRGLLLFSFLRSRPGRILHIDSSGDFMDMCLEHYREAGIRAVGKEVPESEQPHVVRRYLELYRPDILVMTGHDSLKKNSDKFNLNNYRNSKYFIQAVKEARKYEPDVDKLCVFAGACQSYFEAIMEAGANFASSPGRILINALDPAFVSEKVAVTDSREYVTPQEVASLTISGSKGIGGMKTRGHLNR